jgi:hypothetical protein
LAKIAVSAANTADNNAQKNQLETLKVRPPWMPDQIADQRLSAPISQWQRRSIAAGRR